MTRAIDGSSAGSIERRKFLAGLLFCSAAGIAAWRQPRVKLDYLGNQKLDDLVPKTIGPWEFVSASGLVVPPEDGLSKMLYSHMLTRVYSDGRNPDVMLLMAQNGSQTGFLQIHRPEVCYTAGGYHISALSRHPIQIGSKLLIANSIDASAGGPTEHVIYWTRVGDMLPKTWKQQKFAVAEQNLRGIIPDAILVRVSCVTDDADAARTTMDAFVRAMINSIPANRRSVFIV